MNNILPIVIRGTQAALNKAMANELDFTIAALEETIHELRQVKLDACTNDAGVAKPSELQAA